MAIRALEAGHSFEPSVLCNAVFLMKLCFSNANHLFPIPLQLVTNETQAVLNFML